MRGAERGRLVRDQGANGPAGDVGLHLEPQVAARAAADHPELVAAEAQLVEPVHEVAEGERAALQQRAAEVARPWLRLSPEKTPRACSFQRGVVDPLTAPAGT